MDKKEKNIKSDIDELKKKIDKKFIEYGWETKKEVDKTKGSTTKKAKKKIKKNK